MNILDWFKNRPGQFDLDRSSDEIVQQSVDKAITLINPRLRILANCEKRLLPAVATTINFLRAQVSLLPAVHAVSSKTWSSDPALKAFFVTPSDIPILLGRSENLRTLFEKYPELDEAYLVLGMAFNEHRSFGLALQGEMVQRDVAQKSVSFSDHQARICSRDESHLRRIIGIEVFEHLIAQALSEIGKERLERQELQSNSALIRARLRLLEQHGPGLGSMFGAAPAGGDEQARLDAELLENERQLAAIGGSESVLEAELEGLKTVFENPQHYLHFEPKRLRLSSMNVVLDETSTEQAANVDFAIAQLSGLQPIRRAFVLARVAREDMPAPQKMRFDHLAHYL